MGESALKYVRRIMATGKFWAAVFVLATVAAGCTKQSPVGQLPSSPVAPAAAESPPDFSVPAFSFSLPERGALRLPTFQPAGLVVPHHLLAAELMAQAYARVDPSAYRQIVVISPDHFMPATGSIYLAAFRVQTAYGMVPAAVIPPKLEAFRRFSAEQVQREHGLALQLPFIARYFPNVPVLLVAVRPDATDEELRALAEKLQSPATLYVLSFDFSHDQSPIWAEYHDRAAVAALRTSEVERIAGLEVDVQTALRLFFEIMAERRTRRFTLFANENTQTVNPQGSYAQVTSYVTGAYFSGQPEPERGLSLTFTGDMMLDRKVYANGKRLGGLDYPFRLIPRLLWGDDYTVVNHEGPMTTRAYHAPITYPDPNNTTFNFDPAYRQFIQANGVEVFGLANNHTLNMGAAGLAETRRLLEESGGLVFGDPGKISEPFIIAVHNPTTTVYAIWDTDAVRYVDFAKILPKKNSGEFIAALMHWGTEYSPKFSARQQRIAHGLIDAGVDVVIGTGPHVLEPIEVYKGKAIFYSLGNFIFDQDWSAPTQQGLVVGVRIEMRDVTYYLQPVSMFSGQVAAATSTASITLGFLADTFVGPAEFRTGLKAGKMILSHQ